ncbi:hypothetical protein RB614_41040 [Phytohabitans sp. ZYX-F-186]|uniref:Uncharacterized protein n=1 Tax=Phytohabitans maris TaxID=3071409 RepID=A0ABU0ZVR0_9ACTN|nr:hypothetical protein [Phytohabitans sp. ZYX-F-186]MDQ7910896.1 hypothetical protein [Phytohabitans sp. ZYX-F-186]
MSESTVAELAKRFERGVSDVDELVAALEAAGINDRVAARRYGQPTVFALGEAVLARLEQPPARAPRPKPYVWAALRRSALLLTPVACALAAADEVARVGWAVPALAAVLGWAAARGRVYAAAGAPLVATACALAPASVVGPAGDRGLALAVGLTGYALVAGLGAGLRWAVPAWVAAGALLAGAGDRVEVLPLAAAPMLAGALLVRERAPVTGVVAALGQGALAVLVWRAAPDAAVLALGVPLLVFVVCWHEARAATAADAHDDLRAFHREVRDLGTVTVGALVPPLVAGVALGAAAYRLPYQISGHPGARGLVLSGAAVLLLGGVLALTALLVARARPVVAAVVAAGPLSALAAGGTLLPATVAALAVTYLVGLMLAAHAVFDPERY